VGIVINIRGTNGAGKTTLAKAFLPPNLRGDSHGGPVDLNWYSSPTKRDPLRQLRVEGYVRHDEDEPTIAVVGPYRTATGGLDNVPSFAVQQAAILYALGEGSNTYSQVFREVDAVIAEGVLASTVYGSWGEFAATVKDLGHQFAFCYLQTPLDICFDRIRQRQEASGKVKEIKRDLVADKFKAIAATRAKALAAGKLVYDLPFGGEVDVVWKIITGRGAEYATHA
jgi:hypothetical protein